MTARIDLLQRCRCTATVNTAEGIDVLPVRDFLDEIEGDRLFA